MLRSVLGDYLDRLADERAFDVPFQALLAAMGYFDIHLTHGRNEMGKDFIAKLRDGDEVQQWTFQSKKGDIKLGEWRSELQGQMLTCEATGLLHPNFDSSLPRQSVLLTTGRLAESVNNEIDSFSETMLRPANRRPLQVWSKPVLIDLLEKHGLAALQGSLTGPSSRFGPFYTIYGRAVSGELVLEDFEEYSRNWLATDSPPEQVLLAGSVEASILAAQCRTTMGSYEALFVELAALRTICFHWYRNSNEDRKSFYQELHDAQLERILTSCNLHVDEIRQAREAAEGHLDRAISSFAIIVAYPVTCFRAMEAASLGYFIEKSDELQAKFAAFLNELVENEPGCWHPISDRYAVSLVVATLALMASGHQQAAKKLLVNALLFVGDRYEKGFGLASVDGTVRDEVEQLLAYPFQSFELHRNATSLLATAIGDLAAFLGDPMLYEDVINEIKACRIYPQYWQPVDSEGQFMLDGADVIQYSTTEFDDVSSPFSDFNYAEHVREEARTFQLQSERGSTSFLCIAALLRDRYFLSQWLPLMPPTHASVISPV